MARETSSAKPSAQQITELDLSSVYGFERCTDWVRDSVLLSQSSAPVLELRVRLPGVSSTAAPHVSLLMDPMDAYIVGFRGRDGIYVLRDPGKDIASRLKQAKLIGNDETPRVLNIGTDHRSLGTFRPVSGSAGMRPREFDAMDLRRISRLSDFSENSQAVSYSDVCDAISLLVCLIAESARARMVELSFQGLYYNKRVRADEAFQSYDQAKQITRFANRLFPNPVLAYRVEKLKKRATEIDSLLERARHLAKIAKFDAREFTSRALAGTAPEQPKELVSAAFRLREMAQELRTNADEMLRIVYLCSNEHAVRAAMYGVVTPPISETRR